MHIFSSPLGLLRSKKWKQRRGPWRWTCGSSNSSWCFTRHRYKWRCLPWFSNDPTIQVCTATVLACVLCNPILVAGETIGKPKVKLIGLEISWGIRVSVETETLIADRGHPLTDIWFWTCSWTLLWAVPSKERLPIIISIIFIYILLWLLLQL